jgi:hypothetical protein
LSTTDPSIHPSTHPPPRPAPPPVHPPEADSAERSGTIKKKERKKKEKKKKRKGEKKGEKKKRGRKKKGKKKKKGREEKALLKAPCPCKLAHCQAQRFTARIYSIHRIHRVYVHIFYAHHVATIIADLPSFAVPPRYHRCYMTLYYY